MTVKEHYQNHLSPIYTWMTGDIKQPSEEFYQLIIDNKISPRNSKVALDLGAGNGIQSLALAKMGFEVLAIDFDETLLGELNALHHHSIKTMQQDIRDIMHFESLKPELIVCGGDTITHLNSQTELAQLIADCYQILLPGGHFVLTFRDYSTELVGAQRFIPVKSDADRILTCVLEYEPEKVIVTDLLHEKSESGWIQKVSSYQKIRISPVVMAQILQNSGFEIIFNKSINRMQTMIVEK